MKKRIESTKDRNAIINDIINLLIEKNNFLIMVHNNPDEDAISSAVAFAILVKKFQKNVCIFIKDDIHDHFEYLVRICEYNNINITKKYDDKTCPAEAIVVLDTPKPAMVCHSAKTKSLMESGKVPVVEIDHHLGADSQNIGDSKYRLVDEASSASELVGLVALKLKNKKRLLKKYNIENPLSRNIVLAILTGIIGDTNMGKYLKTKREKKYYDMFSELYNQILSQETTKKSNFSDKEEVYLELKRLSADEENCYNTMLKKKKCSDAICYVSFTQKESENLFNKYQPDTVISVARSIADLFAEESKKLSLVSYYDSELLQMRVRRSEKFKVFDVREILPALEITSGGGHEGAIGFRVPSKEVENHNAFIKRIVSVINSMIVNQQV